MPEVKESVTKEPCKLCKKTFNKTRSWKSFCSDNCRRTWYNKLRKWADYRIRNSEEDMRDFLRHSEILRDIK